MWFNLNQCVKSNVWPPYNSYIVIEEIGIDQICRPSITYLPNRGPTTVTSRYLRCKHSIQIPYRYGSNSKKSPESIFEPNIYLPQILLKQENKSLNYRQTTIEMSQTEQFNPDYSEGDLWSSDGSSQTDAYASSSYSSSAASSSCWSTYSTYSTESNCNNPGYATSGYDADLESMASSKPWPKLFQKC